MRFALMTEPQQGIDYQEILAIAQAAEAAGFEGFFRSDHYTSFPGPTGLHTTDAWATLAGSRARDAAHPARHARVARSRSASRASSPRSPRPWTR